jgi:hypothetical protein
MPYGQAPNAAMRCDFSLFWVRIAWSHMITTHKTDVTLLPRMAMIPRTAEPCPNAGLWADNQPKPAASRVWYGVGHPDNGMPMSGFSLCPSCVTHIANICTPIQNVFVPLSQTPTNGVCDFVPSSAFVDKTTYAYLMKMEECANTTAQYGQINMRPLTTMIAQNAPSGSAQTIAGPGALAGTGAATGYQQPGAPSAVRGMCPRDVPTANMTCHIMQGVPDFIVCEKCYAEVIAPGVARGEQLARSVSTVPAMTSAPVTCQLYSNRMRHEWTQTAATNDLDHLRQKVMSSTPHVPCVQY